MKESREANARLVAAAPDLLAALEILVADARNARENADNRDRYARAMAWLELDRACQDAEAAIRKARGDAGRS